MKLFTKLFLTFALLCFANVVFATEDDTLPLDIQFGPDYNDASVQTYTDTWTATKDGKTWTITNFNNNKNGWTSIKCGRKNNASVATIASPAINAVVTNYVVTVAKASNVNSAKLTIKNGEEQVGEDIDITENFVGDSLLAVGDEELIKIHYHTNEPWKVLEYCRTLGEIYDIVVEDMDRQARGLQG